MIRAFGYLRISYDPQGTSLSPERQRAAIQTAAEAKGFEVTDWFEDRDVSAYQRRRRPAWEDLMARLDETRAVFVWRLDRAWRRTAPAMTLLELLDDKGIRLVSVDQGFDSQTSSRANIEMFFVMAAEESRAIASRTTAAHRHNALVRKRLTHPRRMFGFNYDPATKTISVNEDEAAILRRMAESYLSGQGEHSIATALNTGTLMGFVVSAPKAQWWGDATVKQMLTSPRMAGFVRYQGQIVEDEPSLPAVFDLDTWQRLQAVRHERRRTGRRPSRGPGQLLYGLARCGTCGGPMNGHEVKKVRTQGRRAEYRFYHCSRGVHAHCTGPARIALTQLDDHVTRWFFDHLDAAALQDAEAELVDDDPSREARTEMARIERAISRLMDAYATDEVLRASFDQKLADYRDELTMWSDKVAHIERKNHLRVDTRDVSALWPRMDVAMRREVLTSVIDRVVVHRGSLWKQDKTGLVEVHPR